MCGRSLADRADHDRPVMVVRGLTSPRQTVRLFLDGTTSPEEVKSMARKRNKAATKVRDLKGRAVKDLTKDKRQANPPRRRSSQTSPKGTQVSPSQTKVIAHP